MWGDKFVCLLIAQSSYNLKAIRKMKKIKKALKGGGLTFL